MNSRKIFLAALNKLLTAAIFMFSFLLFHNKVIADSTPSYQAFWVGQNTHVVHAEPGQSIQLMVELKNIGSATWRQDNFRLGTTQTQDRIPQFIREDIQKQSKSGWITPNRVQMVENATEPGKIADFSFWYSVPNDLPPGTYHETFSPVADGVTWVSNAEFTWDIIVDNGYHAMLVSESASPIATPEGTVNFEATLLNTGSTTWKKGVVNLGTDLPKDRISQFIQGGEQNNTLPSGWISNNRVELVEDSVAPGKTGTFRFSYKIPSSIQDGIYFEYFRPVADEIAWFDDPEIQWFIVVHSDAKPIINSSSDTSTENKPGATPMPTVAPSIIADPPISAPTTDPLPVIQTPQPEEPTADKPASAPTNTPTSQTSDVNVSTPSPAQTETTSAPTPTPIESPQVTITNPFIGAKIQADPEGFATAQVKAWQTDRPNDAALIQKIAQTPEAKWMSGGDSSLPQQDVDYLNTIYGEGYTPFIVLYHIPVRDCGGLAGGGATDDSSYQSWIQSFVDAVNNRKAIVVYEPDAASDSGCFNNQRIATMHAAVQKLKTNTNIAVYIDAGNPYWLKPDVIANRLNQVGIDLADGFAVNVANSAWDKDNIAYGDAISKLVHDKHYIIDTSRNGQGPTPDHQWCNPQGLGLGKPFTTNTGDSQIDAFIWVKPPGTSDGQCHPGDISYGWWPDYALGLAQRASW